MAQSTRKKHCGACNLKGHSARTCETRKKGNENARKQK